MTPIAARATRLEKKRNMRGAWAFLAVFVVLLVLVGTLERM